MEQPTTTNLPIIRSGTVVGKSVIVRADLEADSETDPRFVATLELVNWLKSEQAGAIKVVGHKGEVWMVTALGVTLNY
ncbi:MAG: hypothetical protein Q7S31_01710, partial [bacterium]|nr:hypothetical protein [bacterium]